MKVITTFGAALAIVGFFAALRFDPVQRRSPGATPAAELSAVIDDIVTSGASGDEGTGAADDLSAASFADRLARTRADLTRLRNIDRTVLPLDDRLDLRFAETILVGRELSLGQMQFWKKDPRVYLSFRGLDRIIGEQGAPDAKRENLLHVLRTSAQQLANGQKNLDVYVPRFQEIGVFAATAALDIFDKQVPAFAAKLTTGREEVLAANDATRAALGSFLEYLKNGLPKRPHGDFAVGKATYDAMLKGQYLLPYTSDTLYKYAWDEFNRTVRDLEHVAKTIDPNKTWQQLLVEVKKDQPDPAKLIEAHQDMVNKAREQILSKHIIPIPWKERCDVVIRPEYQRKNSFYGQFSNARARSPLPDGTLVGNWQLNPFDPQWDEKTKREFMTEHDWGAMYVIAPHETYPGHHVQGLYQMHNPRKLRRTQGTSLFSEGWGLYTEQLMQETGFLPNQRIHVQQLQSRLWRNARLIFVVGMHTGKMTYDEAMSFMTDKVGFTRYAAEAEISRGISSPDQQMSYFMGMTEIVRMREDYKQRLGAKFSLSDFHERLLKIGSMPVSLMREALFAEIPAAQ